MTVLLDANVLIAVVVADHVHHAAAAGWLRGRTFATCPITQGALVRLLVREGFPGAEARTVLERVTAAPAHEFWPDGIGYDRVDLRGVVGHRQVTDAYLASADDEFLQQKTTVKPLGEMPIQSAIGNMCLTHGFTHLGEIAHLRGLMGLKGMAV